MMKYLLLFSLLCFSSLGFAQEGSTTIPTKPPEEKAVQPAIFHFLMPINWTVPEKYNLAVQIPSNFESIQPMSVWATGKSPLIEFIPKGESADNWNEIITLNLFINKAISAEHFVKFLYDNMLEKTTNSKAWQEIKIERSPAYTAASAGISYEFAGRKEVFGCRYYSGPYDCSGIQYTIRPKKGESEQQAIEKIENYFRSNTQVVPPLKS